MATLPFTYLGLPLSNKKLPKTAYLPLLQRMNKRLGGWAAKHLSIAGRIVLVNSVLSALPTYFMSCLKLPEWVIKDIDKIRRSFLWHGVAPNQTKMNLANWSLVCTPKEFGGLGVMDLAVFNQALLIKWYWQWARPQNNLWKPILRISIGHDGLPLSPIFTTALKTATQFCQMSFTHTIGNGEQIQLWNHKWRGIPLCQTLPNLYSHAIDQNVTLQEIITSTSLEGFFRLIISDIAMAEFRSLQSLLAQLTTHPNTPDDIVWIWTESGIFTVKSAYRALKFIPRIAIVANRIHKVWKLNIPPRMKVFGWLMSHNKLLTVDNLNKRGWSLVNRCILCKADLESINHMINVCPFSLAVYSAVFLHIPDGMPLSSTPYTEAILSPKFSKKQRGTLLITQFVIWRERCSRIFRESNKEVEELKGEVLWQLQFCEK